MDCKICGTPMADWFDVPGDWRKPDKDISFKVQRCSADGFSCVAPDISEETLADHYDISGYYTHAPDQADAKRKTVPLAFKIMQKIAYNLDFGVQSDDALFQGQFPKGSKALDIGAGGGRKLLALRDHGFDAYGVEPDENAASRQPDFALPVYAGTAESIPKDLPRGSFDLVICTHVLEHTQNPMLALENIFALLKPGGTLIAEVPNTDCIDFHLSKLNWQHLGVPRHLVFWKKSSLDLAATKTGFAQPDFKYRFYQRQFNWSWIQFGRPMVDYYRKRGAYRASIKQYTTAYSLGLLALTIFAPARRSYDSVCMIAKKP